MKCKKYFFGIKGAFNKPFSLIMTIIVFGTFFYLIDFNLEIMPILLLPMVLSVLLSGFSINEKGLCPLPIPFYVSFATLKWNQVKAIKSENKTLKILFLNGRRVEIPLSVISAERLLFDLRAICEEANPLINFLEGKIERK